MGLSGLDKPALGGSGRTIEIAAPIGTARSSVCDCLCRWAEAPNKVLLTPEALYIIRPGLEHLLPLIAVLRPVVHPTHTTDCVVECLLYNV